jgi:hypothetical protein
MGHRRRHLFASRGRVESDDHMHVHGRPRDRFPVLRLRHGLPANFCGGLLKLAITATPDSAPSVHLAAALTINCEIGPNVPASVVEGVRVNVYDVVNFNKPVEESGVNIYIAQ